MNAARLTRHNSNSHEGLEPVSQAREAYLTNTEINIGVDTSQSQLDIFIRHLDVFFSVENTALGVTDAVKKLRSYQPQRVLIEATGRLEMTFVCAAHKAGLPVVVCNAVQVRKFAGASGRIAKTDKIDAQCIAHFGEAVRPRLTEMKSENLQQISDLLAVRYQCLDMSTMQKTGYNACQRAFRRLPKEYTIAFRKKWRVLINDSTN